MDHNLTDLIDVEENRRLLESFCETVGVAAAIIDLEGNVIVGARWQRICTAFHRANEASCKRCVESDTELANALRQGEKFLLYKCRNGMTDAASPIVIEEQHIANVFVGQFLLAPPENEYFRRQAAEFGFDETDYLDALAQVPVLPEEKITPIIDFLTSYAETVASMGLERLRRKQNEEELLQHRGHLEEMVRERTDELERSNEKLGAEVQERKQTEEALRTSREQFRIIADYTYDWEGWHDAAGKLLWANPAVERMTGYSVDECMTMTDYPEPLIEPEDLQVIRRSMEKAMAGEEGNDVPFRVRRKDGQVIWAAVSWNPVFDGEGRFIGFRTSARDFTDRKAAEDRGQLLLESAGEGIFGVDLDGITTFANPAAARMLGYDVNALVGQPVHDLIHHSHSDGSPYPLEECPMYAAYTDGTVHHVSDEVLWNKDGTGFPVEYTATPMHRDGNLAGAVVTFMDITERKEAEQALRDSEKRMSEIINFLPDATWVVDNEGEVVAWNRTIEGLLGVKGEEIIGKGDFEYALPLYGERRPVLIDLVRDWKAEYEKEYLSVKKEGDKLTSESFHPHLGDGGIYLHATAARLYNPSGEVVGAIESLRDITDRKGMEQELIDATLAADEANKAKSTFLANMSHELRTPLNGVLGYAQLLRRDPDMSQSQRDSLDAIESCGQHLLTLINDVLDLSKIEAGRLEIDQKPCEFHGLLKSVIDITAPKAQGKGLEIALNVAPDVPGWIVTDATKLKQVLVNLMGNSVKFTPQGSVELHVELEPGARLRMEVRDTGIGMTPEEMQEIFDPFKQVEGGKTEGGTGLGLTISQRIVEGLGGSLLVESTPGKGTCFTVIHPWIEVAEGDLSPMGEEEPLDLDQPVLAPGQDVRILVADDRATNRDILIKLLQASGFETAEATNGREALARLREGRYPLVFMDVRMPEMDGIEATREIRQDPELKETVVIAVTASVLQEFKDHAIEFGFDDFLGKPLMASEVYGRIRKHLNVKYLDARAEETSERSEERAESTPLPAGRAGEIATRLRDMLKLRNLTAINALASELTASSDASQVGEQIADLSRAFDFDGLGELAQTLENTEKG